jgi:excisionase family DNA binding protein
MAVNEYVTVAEAADVLGVNRRTVWRLINQGQLQAITNPIDRRAKLIRREDLERVAHPGAHDGAPDSLHHPWPQTAGAADLGVRSDQVEEWLEANWRPA